MIITWIKNLFKSASGNIGYYTKKTGDADFDEPILSFGSFIDEPDIRDILVTDLPPTGKNPVDEYRTDITFLPTTNQRRNGSCVGHAEGLIAEYFRRQEKLVGQVSRRYLYAIAKSIDGLKEEGTYPRIVSGILRHKGTPREDLVPNDDELPHDKYIDFMTTLAIENDARLQRVKGYARVPINDVIIKKALQDYKLVAITILVDFSAGWKSRSGLLKKPDPKKVVNTHRIILYGYTTVSGATLYYFRNSWGSRWGKRGNGTFLFSDYNNALYDARIYTDIPNEIINNAIMQKYTFTKTLKLGSTGPDVSELQKVLGIVQNGLFDEETKNAVETFQLLYDLGADGIVGPKTRAILNGSSLEGEKPTTVQFAEAIKQHEGWFAGSRSQRNNNPGNIRYAKQIGTTGQDSKGFAIFKTYDEGFACLIRLIENAKNGKSQVYKSEMTFAEFFGVYAPAFDSNDPHRYAQFVAQKLKVDVDYKIKDLV